jgi:hypothetical protein
MRFRKPGFTFSLVLAIAGGLAVLASLTFLNLDGYQNEPFGPRNFYSEPPDINWTHGWPYVCMGRLSLSAGPLMMKVVQPSITSRWPFEGTPATYFYAKPLIADILIGVVSVTTTLWSFSYLGRRWSLHRFSLKFLFVLITAIAVAFALWRPDFASRFVQYRIAITILAAAAVVAIVASIHVVGDRLRRIISTP